MITIALMLVKIVLTVSFILFLSVLAEKVGPRVSGVITGIPTATAIILFFYGIEQGVDFAVQSSVFNLAGMLSLHTFIFMYFLVSKNNSKKNIFLSTLVSLAGYFLVVFFLQQIEFDIFGAVIVSLLSVSIFSYMLRKIEDTKIKKKVKLTFRVMLSRSLIASFIVVIITNIPQIVGTELAGIFSSFPTTVLPLVLIIHSSYGNKNAHTILKNVLNGQWAVIIYVVSLFFLLPILGVYLGTVSSYIFVFLYLALFFKIIPRIKVSS